MDLHRAWRFELDPNDRVKTLLAQHAGTARFAWNWSLARRIERFKTQEDKAKFTNAMAEHKALVGIQDQGWGEFSRQLGYKTQWYGSRLVVASRWFPSSKMCSDCGFILKWLPLDTREWVCPSCGCWHDRDENAAINLEKLGYPEFPGNQGCEPIKPVEIPLTAERSRAIVRSTSQGSGKQEANIGVVQ